MILDDVDRAEFKMRPLISSWQGWRTRGCLVLMPEPQPLLPLAPRSFRSSSVQHRACGLLSVPKKFDLFFAVQDVALQPDVLHALAFEPLG